jgi:hypothetical protein
MLTTKRKPATVGEILIEEFKQPMGSTQTALAEAMGVQRESGSNARSHWAWKRDPLRRWVQNTLRPAFAVLF